ncbi:MT-A70-domain-containing protein [Teratosphaeria nubilosa]|uniref:MT-A70-domain-containing protein n=1 Tax=Teratosphaeria nubilosa TaxID=161662 RepID=A0A6G1L183_9PEZI|nr:MT-A70-domain-containing protein [Teratosphaeria nubilosa]
MMRSQSHILWRNDDKSITLLDVPGSIAAAQGTEEHPYLGHLVSSVPLQSPFASNEPRTPAARAKLALSPAAQLIGEEYCRLLDDALKQVRGQCLGPWCLPRPYTTAAPPGKKRKSESLDDGMDLLSATNPPSMSEVVDAPPGSIRVRVESLDDSVIEGEMCNGRFHFVTDDDAASQVTTDERPGYRMPARSCVVLDDCANADIFHRAVTTQAERDGSGPEFDFCVIDPPWPSRSVKRTHRTAGSTYATSATVEELKALLLGTRLDTLMADGCLVGMWITNKPAVRDVVLGSSGIFSQWGLSLTEEWIWLKTTMHGEPVTQLDGLWRRPYEVLLLGRKQSEPSASTGDSSDVVRRVILAVPDLHSRKPCLKSLIEEKMADASSYKALEVFARHLVAGWWSWGNECIKFNWEGYWRA